MLPYRSNETGPRAVSVLIERGALDVGRGSIEARIVFPVVAEGRHEFLVDRVVEIRRVPAGSDDAERLVAHVSQHGFIERSHPADDIDLALEPVFVELLVPAEAVRSGESEKDAV